MARPVAGRVARSRSSWASPSRDSSGSFCLSLHEFPGLQNTCPTHRRPLRSMAWKGEALGELPVPPSGPVSSASPARHSPLPAEPALEILEEAGSTAGPQRQAWIRPRLYVDQKKQSDLLSIPRGAHRGLRWLVGCVSLWSWGSPFPTKDSPGHPHLKGP